MDDDSDVPFKNLLEHEHPEVYEYIKNAVRMLQRQQNLLAKIKMNGGSADQKVKKEKKIVFRLIYITYCWYNGILLFARQLPTVVKNEKNEQLVAGSVKTEINVPNDWEEVTDSSNENSVDSPDDVSIEYDRKTKSGYFFTVNSRISFFFF